MHSSGCGMHPSMIGKVSFAIEEDACPGCATIARYQRVLAERDEKHRAKHKDAAPGDRLPSDGLHVHLRVLTPQEARERAQGEAQKAEGGEHG